MTQNVSTRFYGGIWRALVDWFSVPDHPPDLPGAVERFQPSPGFLKYLKFKFWLGLTAMDLAFFVAWIATFFVSIWLGVALAPVFIAVAILPDVVAFVAIHLRYDSTWYVLSNRSLRIRRGIWVIRETTITFENVQHVKVQQGPLQRHYGIADVQVTTAGGGSASGQEGAGQSTSTHVGMIEGVSDAARIRDLIMAKVRQSRAAGIGDEDQRSASGWTPNHVGVLREIRDALAVACVAVLFLSACNEEAPVAEQRTTPEALMEADRAFAAETAARGLDGWMSYYAEDAARVQLGTGSVRGPEAIRGFDAAIFEDSTTRLVWVPTDAGVFDDGRHGFTTGRSAFVRIDGDIPDTMNTGRYVTIWRLDDEGRPRVILDTGVLDP